MNQEINKKAKTGQSLSRTVTVLIFTMVILSGGFIGIMSYIVNRNMVIERYAEKSMFIAQTVVSGIHTEKFSTIMETGEKDEYWYEIKES